MMNHRVVITGMGVLAPIGHTLAEFEQALRNGRSGIEFQPDLQTLGFACQVAGRPRHVEALQAEYFDPVTLIGMDRHAVIGCIAGLDAWRDAGFSSERRDEVDWETAISFGSALGGIETVGRTLVPLTEAAQVRRMGSAIPEKIMGNAVGARLAGLLGAGGHCSSNSSACATGSEAIVNGYWMVRDGRAKRVLAGGSEGDSPYIWAGFDAMRVLSRQFNDAPEKASRPLSATAGGFVPASGSGALVLETLDSAVERGARIYGEIAGAAVNCGGQRNGGTMTAGNPEGIRRCIQSAVASSGIEAAEIDLISGHLTATKADPFELANWRDALGLNAASFPFVNAPKSLLGHTLGAAGAIESVAAVLQLFHGFVHPSLNCEDLHPAVAWCESRIVQECRQEQLRVVAKTAFGFGDVNSCLLFRQVTH